MGGQGPAMASPKKNWSGTLDPRLVVVRIGAVVAGLRQVPSKPTPSACPLRSTDRRLARLAGSSLPR